MKLQCGRSTYFRLLGALLLLGLMFLTKTTTAKTSQITAQPTFKFVFSQGRPDQFVDSAVSREVEYLKRVLAESREQSDWRFILMGYAPASCVNLKCPEVQLLKRRVEMIAGQVGNSSFKDNRLSWKTSPSLDPNQIRLFLDSSSSKDTDRSCKGEISIQSDLLPPKETQTHLSRPQRIGWGTMAPANEGSLIYYSIPNGTEVIFSDANNRIIIASGSNFTRISANQLPIEIQIKSRESSERIGPVLKPWNGQSFSPSNSEKPCKIILNSW